MTSKDVHIALDAALLGEVFRRAERLDHVRIDADDWTSDKRGSASVRIWAAGFTGDRELAESAVARIAWRGALGGDGFAAAIVRIEWDPGQGGSEELVWQALGILAGRSLRSA